MKTKNKTKITYKIISLFIIFLISSSVLMPLRDTNAKGNEMVVIPKKAVRLRILANSDSSEDQALKRKVRDEVNAQINTWVKDLTTFEEGQKVIKSHIPDLQKTVARVIKEEGSNQSFTITYSKKVKFPTKLYGSFLYPAGDYEAVLIKLGAGQGANWWCVLFPPLCFLDFSNGDATLSKESLQSQQKVDHETKIENEPKREFKKQEALRLSDDDSNSATKQNNESLQDDSNSATKQNNESLQDDTEVKSSEDAVVASALPGDEPKEDIKVESFFVQMLKQLF
ncbi:stage II sporulation protein R [Bacillus sp. AFS053548]|uniref:stage II sporulation protein R n=1 Tax=Bacillus sp. AFS053548 TaxID=2033505 RepID=UPI000BFD6609|nr:stage II sporulation protein R [Bacillus sp. AFS053548]PGM59193.1 stage II sporulation protein R [Bacillus sp. AFS053548]